jgi:alpha-tubulin suppressor-like RCC1 family protein
MRRLLVLLLAASALGCPQTTPTTPPPRPPTPPVTTPPPVAQVPDPALEVASQSFHSCARRKSGEVSCWGKNTYGQLGDGKREDASGPVKVPLVGAVQLALGRDFSCARRSGGDVVCWGNDEDGQLGGGGGGRPGSMSVRPVKVTGLQRVVAISGGEYHMCALDDAGAVWCWGNAGNGQIGSDAQRAFPRPQRIAGLGKASAIASGAHHVCALETAGTVKCWGRNTEGQLGDGKSGSRLKPVAVSGIETASAIASGHNHSCATFPGGAVRCWGDNAFGQLGPGAGSARKQNTPVNVVGLSRVVEVVGGLSHTCVRLDSGRVVCWGGNDRGQAGQAMNVPRVPKPTPVRGLGDAIDLAAGAQHGCIARATGEIACWGTPDVQALGPYRLI